MTAPENIIKVIKTTKKLLSKRLKLTINLMHMDLNQRRGKEDQRSTPPSGSLCKIGYSREVAMDKQCCQLPLFVALAQNMPVLSIAALSFNQQHTVDTLICTATFTMGGNGTEI